MPGPSATAISAWFTRTMGARASSTVADQPRSQLLAHDEEARAFRADVETTRVRGHEDLGSGPNETPASSFRPRASSGVTSASRWESRPIAAGMPSARTTASSSGRMRGRSATQARALPGTLEQPDEGRDRIAREHAAVAREGGRKRHRSGGRR